MYKPHIFNLIVLGILLHCTFLANGQTLSYDQLERKVYSLNNSFRYKESQKLLMPLLQDEQYTADQHYQAAVLLSYTYKRVFDYQSTMKYLRVARNYAVRSPRKNAYMATIRSEEAFAYFDTQAYKQADQIMNELEKTNYDYLTQENKAMLIMQQGYLRFLNKDYELAQVKYNKAIDFMRASAPCNLPMIQVKQMQLFAAMSQTDRMDEALRQAITQAKECHIIKYQLYAYEELREIYRRRHDQLRLLQTQQKLDTLTNIYAKEKNIALLHNQNENLLMAEADRQNQEHQIRQQWLEKGLLSVILLMLLLLGRMRFIRMQQSRMRQQIQSYLSTSSNPLSPEATKDKDCQSLMSHRQQEVLNCMNRGMGNKQIAAQLCISENTVKYHIKNIYQMLNVNNRKEFLVKSN